MFHLSPVSGFAAIVRRAARPSKASQREATRRTRRASFVNRAIEWHAGERPFFH